MTNKIMKAEDGKYHIKGKVYELLEGSRTQVNNGTAYRTTGGLTKDDILMNKNGYLVSKKKHITATKEKRLVKYGFITRKGHFGNIKKGKYVKLTAKHNKNNSTKAKKISKASKTKKHHKKMKGGISDSEVDNICNSGEINCSGLSFEERKRKVEDYLYEKAQTEKHLEIAKQTKPSAYGTSETTTMTSEKSADWTPDFSKMTISRPTTTTSSYRPRSWEPVEQKKTTTGWTSKKFGYNK